MHNIFKEQNFVGFSQWNIQKLLEVLRLTIEEEVAY